MKSKNHGKRDLRDLVKWTQVGSKFETFHLLSKGLKQKQPKYITDFREQQSNKEKDLTNNSKNLQSLDAVRKQQRYAYIG